jgi:hypothetical protein
MNTIPHDAQLVSFNGWLAVFSLPDGTTLGISIGSLRELAPEHRSYEIALAKVEAFIA